MRVVFDGIYRQMEETLHFVNKSASDTNLSRSDAKEGVYIRRFIQKRNRKLERMRKNGLTSVQGDKQLLEVAPGVTDTHSGKNGGPRRTTSNNSFCFSGWVHHHDTRSYACRQEEKHYSGCIRRYRADRAPVDLDSLCKSLSERSAWPLAEQRGVHYFTTIISASFTTEECSAFWHVWVPCVLEQNDGVRLLVTALALFHEANGVATTDLEYMQHCERAALVHYNKAIKYIQEHGDLMRKLTLVMTCILVVSIETLRGNLMAVEVCINSGLAMSHTSKAALLEYRWKYPIMNTESVPVERAIQVTQAKMSAAFDVFATRANPPNCQSVLGASRTRLEVPNGFANIEDVNTQAEKLYGATFRALESLRKNHRIVRDSTMVVASLHEFGNFHYRLNCFRSSGICPSAIARLSRRTMVQEMKVLEAQIIFHNIVLDCDEMSFDRWTSSFERILDIAQDCLKLNTTERHRLVYHPFSITFVPALWLVASRCRVSEVRQRAIDLLQNYPRREKTFDSMMASEVARHIVVMEEGTKAKPLICSEISCRDRVTLQSAEFIHSSTSIQLTYLRGMPGMQQTVQGNIAWPKEKSKSYSDRETVLNTLLQTLLVYSRSDMLDLEFK